ncbi:MAG: metallophosphoesterase [Nitrososphaerota archaeon]|nr:metallophosphoesterase [Nitrososphaerota archaeon]
MSKKTKLYFVTDVHGSDRCFRKFINAGKFYNANVLILGGDITGKMIVPIISRDNGTWETGYSGTVTVLKTKEEANTLAKSISDSGFYPYFTERKQVEEMNASKEKVDSLFKELMVEGIRGWMHLAEERLKGTGISCYISPGNDDIFEIDDVLSSSSYVVNPEEKVVRIDDHHEMITLGYTNHTPWNSPREVDEEVLEQKIEAMASKLENPANAIWNIHVPPIDTPIDQAPKLDSTLKPVISGGHMVMISAGSVATRKTIEKYQPLIGIHGHIHESKGIVKIGKTMCFNPGSEYGEGILRGLICELEDSKVKSYMLTSG